MNYRPILIVAGEPNSVFLEIFHKSISHKRFKNPIILIGSNKLLLLQMKKLKFNININLLDLKKLNSYKLNNKAINLINVEYNQKKPFEKISNKSTKYIKKSFEIAFK